MNTSPPRLDLTGDPVALTAALVDIASPSHQETAIADALESALRGTVPDEVEVLRYHNNVLARTHRGLGSRVILAGHIDTVPLADNVPHRRGRDAQGRDTLFGCGTVDMKSGLAVYAQVFATLAVADSLRHDLTFIAYEGEEVATEFNGLGHLAEAHTDWLRGDLALLGEPSGGVIEAGCQGSIRLRVRATGTRAHSARSWLGDNAVHRLSPVLGRIAAYTPRDAVELDGCVYREGLNVVRMEAGVANNTVPDDAWFFVNFRFAPDRSSEQAMEHLLDVLAIEGEDNLSYEVDDVAAAAAPGLAAPAARDLVRAVGGRVRAKYGWTDVSRFGQLGIPAVNFGCGDPGYAHKKDEQCPVEQIREVSAVLRRYLTAGTIDGEV
ncbi:succinyl-diaminopimelate desuccinylase [Corynebacterium sp. zg-331]|uniref:succinyl-diaminopimelate desuccinylase n=1 Tax=unclassified Corynebacterium TaxID=2624378 RepID=UPI00128B380D|nr:MULTISPECIES: succinyl-diaminopimelate desuccinylase [unclassified Corynebacterium]MBC3186145.1 succinyl-diaminopimelate desuccinylase [Corynebacterium sp. zg-331]MPV52635.1 succinyl-diaminopimelate desuccinylase [Corynebacterium sp. zg331]